MHDIKHKPFAIFVSNETCSSVEKIENKLKKAFGRNVLKMDFLLTDIIIEHFPNWK